MIYCMFLDVYSIILQSFKKITLCLKFSVDNERNVRLKYLAIALKLFYHPKLVRRKVTSVSKGYCFL